MGRLLKQLLKQVNRNVLKDCLDAKESSETVALRLKSDSVSQSLEALEARIMLDAAGVATTADVIADQVATDQANKAVNASQIDNPPVVQQQKEALREAISATSNSQRASEIVFIDRSIIDYQELLNGIHASAEVILLSSDQDGVEQIASVLSERTQIDAIHIISHGDSGQLNLGNTILTQSSMYGEHADEISIIRQSLSENADILLYGCNFAEGDSGKQAANSLSQLTGADVAASNDLTGDVELGGDWELEVQLGEVQNLQLAERLAEINWQHTLMLTVTDGNTATNAEIVDAVSDPGNGINTSLPADATPSSDNVAIGIFNNFQDSNGRTLASGVVVSTGDINQLPGDADGSGNFGFNTDNTSTDTDDVDLNTIAPNLDQNDVGILTYDFTSDVRKIAVQYIFATEETAGFAPTFTDIFGVYITDQSTGITTTLAAHDIQTEYTSGGFTVNTPDSNPNVETTANTAVLTAVLDLDALSGFGAGSNYTVKFAIADQADSALDSAAFISHFGGALQLDNDADDSSGVIGSGYSATFNDGSGGIAIVDSDVNITNYDVSTNIQTATINLTNSALGDQLVNAGVNAANFNVVGSGTNSITITAIGIQSIANWETALQQIQFNNTLSSPTVITDRSIEIVLSDGVTTSNTATTTIAINDTSAPAQPTINAPIEVDNIINSIEDDDVLVSGTAEAFSNVLVVFDDGVNPIVSVSVVTDALGNWTLTGNEADISALNQGNINISATATDAASNVSVAATTSVNHDSVVAAPTVNSLITNDSTPIITGTFDQVDYAPANGDLQITITGPGPTNLSFDDMDPEVSTDGLGNWTLDLSALPALGDGIYEISVSIVDPAGNTASDITNSELIIDTVAPTAPIVTSISDDTGISGTDEITADNTLQINGTAEANSSVEVFIDGVSLGTTITDALGNWVFDHTSTVLADGSYDITAIATDAAMNISALSATLPIVVDTTVVAPTVNSQATVNTSPVITGTYDANDADGSLTVNIDGVTYTLGVDAALTVTGNTWTLSLSDTGQVLSGPYPASFNVIATVIDNAGNSVSDVSLAEISVNPNQNVDAVDDVLTSIGSNDTSTGALSGLLSNDTNQIAPGATLNFDASNEANTANTIWEDNIGTSGFDWDFSGTGGTGGVSINNSPGSSFSGITASYSFDGTGGAQFSNGAGDDDSFSNIAGNPTNNDASFEVWFKAADTVDEDIIFETGASVDGMSLSINGTVLSLKIRDNGFNIQRTFDLASIGIDPTAEFVQVAWTYDQNNSGTTDQVILYVNGNAVITDTTQTGLNDWAGGNDAGLGFNNEGINFPSGGAFEGDIAIFRFYESVLTAGEVLDNFEVVADADPDANSSSFGLTVNAFDAVSTEGATVIVNADGSYSYDPSTSVAIQALNPGESVIDTFTYTIVDDTGLNTDTATVSIEVFGVAEANLSVTQQGDESGPQNIIYSVSLDAGKVNNTGSAISFDLNFTGGTAGLADITDVSGAGVITIAAGASTGILVVPVIDDMLVETVETLEATISNASSSFVVINNNLAVANINDNDNALNSVTITATDAIASETPTDNGEFTVDLGAVNNTGSAITVNYTISGSATPGADYTTLSGSVVIANGQQTATINVAGIVDDALVEGNETVVATITGTDNALFTIDTANDDATVTINDNDNALNSVTITATDAIASETPTDNGEFTVDLGTVNNTGGDVVVNYTISGSATSGTDYAALSGSVVIANGQQTATINVAGIVDDAIVEGNETVVATITGTDNALFTIDTANDDATVTINDNDNALNSVTITASDPTASETPTDNGEFTVDLGAVNNTGGDVVVNYTISGSATSGTDYAALSGSVVIANGQQTATINVAGIVDDAIVEGNETVVATITSTDNALFTIDTANDDATVIINDNDNALNSVTITATDAIASETPTDNGEFTVDLGAVNNTGGDVVVNYTISGSATPGADYTTLSGSVVIANGQQTATINVAGIVDDALVEGNETVVATITGTDNALFTIDTANDDATVTINDNDNALNSVTITATDAIANETPTDNGEFTIDLGAINNTGSAITVNYTISGSATSGTDYAALSGSVVISNGQQTATINVAGIVDDALVEGNETVVATITGTDNALFTIDTANDDATVTINDNDNALNSVTITATDAIASETPTDNGEFTVDLGAVNNTGSAITVNYTISGSATPGADYTTLSGSVVIANGQQTATINVAGIVDDALVEGNETVVATITGTDNALFTIDTANDDATVTINDNDNALNSVTITASDPTASETPTDNGEFTVDLGAVNNTGGDVVVNYTISGSATSGTDYAALSGSVVIANGQQTATINVAGIVDDAIVEGNETVVATITSTDNALFTIDTANDDATVIINDNDNALNSVTITASDPNASETPTDNGEFTIDLGAINNTGAAVTVNYTITGTATSGTDYAALSGSVVIANGQQTATINVAGIVDDAIVEGNETVVATITGTDNALFTIDTANDDATVTINDNDNALNSVTITASDPTASETPTDNGEFTVDLGAVNNTGGDVVVNYTISGSATSGTDYAALSGSVVIANGQQTATINVAGIVDDAIVEGNETVVATITSTDNALFTIDTANDDATVIINDNDNALNSVTITATDAIASETPTDNGEFTVDLGAVNNTGGDVVVNYTISGSATPGADYTTLSGSVVIANGQQTATINVAGIVDDALVEGNETVVATITGTDNALFTIDTANDDATVTINDNDNALNSVTITATDAIANETPTDNGEFTIDLGAINNTGSAITVNYTISGSATSGTDYAALSGSVVISNGQQTATINVAGIVDDALVEGNETVVATITGTDNALFTIDTANDDATVTINDNDNALNSVTITATDAIASETPTDNGEFTVDLGAVNNTGSAITVNYTISGSATPGADYTTLSGSVVIANGQQTATINVAGIVDDALVEGNETVVATITGTDNALFTIDTANDDATVTINDNDNALNSVTITASDPTASETPTDNGEFTVDLGAVNNTGGDVVVNYTISGSATSGTDYAALSGSVVIANGQQTATINVAGIVDDAIVEGNETVVATITSTDNALFTIDTANDDATVIINDNDNALNSVTITASDPNASETPTDNGEFTIDLGAINNTGAAVTVNYTITGTATSGTDYAALSGSVVIANGQQTATINVAGIVDDAIVEGNETVVATITGTDNALFTIDTANDDATVTINDNDNALNSVTITASDPTASETPTDNGEFTVDLGAVNNTGGDVVVNYTISGSATSGTDYAALSGSVVIANGQQTATINVAGIVDDAIVEGNETVVATITSTDNALFTIDTANDDATVIINDNDNALNSVTITATDAIASETPTDNGEFTVDLGAVNNTGGDVVVNYTISGSATPGADYTTLSGSVVIANGQQTATINVAGIVDDALVEGNETVVATITGTDNALFTIDTANDDATVTINDNDNALNSVTITATDAIANETPTDNGEFTIDLGAINNTGSAITVNYTISGSATSGTDYAALSGSVVISNGQQTATINVAGIVDDALVEGNETVVATITGTDNALFTIDTANDDATVTINDNDNALNSVTITATDAIASETPTDNGEFTVDLGAVNNTGSAITVNYTISGSATPGADYTTLSGSVVIANGQQTATINVAGIVDDALVEGNETVVATITGTDNALFTIDTANDDATVTINDNDNALNSVTITASDPTASETPTDNGEFTVDLGAVNNTGGDVVVNYTISGSATSGTDYAALSGSVVIANGQQTATINVAGIVDDAIVEGNETVVATITSTDNALFTIDTANDDATVIINDNDNALNSVTITASDPNASETPTDNGEFTIDLGAINNTGAAVTVNYTITGTATSGTDYAALSGSVVIANGQQTATINVAGIVDDAIVEGNETVVATITGTDNALFTIDTANDDATVTINDNDNALNSVTITASDPNASETPTDNGEFTIDLGAINNTGAAVTVNYTITGTATSGTDYAALSGSVVIANGQQTATINVAGIVDDAIVEGNETVVATITGTDNALFTIDTANDDATVTINDNDNALNSVTITATDTIASETPTDNGEFTVDLGAVNNTGGDVVVNYTISGSATSGTDYAALSGSVVIANGQQTATINVAGIVDDAIVEGNETVVATITGTDNALFTIDTANDDATITINDNDNALNSVIITASDPNASETPTDNGEFTIDLGAINNTGAAVTVNYTIAGTATATNDYTALSGSVVIANGQQTATINVAGIVDDALIEGNETVVATITGTDNALFTVDTANDDATVTINDNDNALNSVTITASDPTASETPTDNGEFTVDLGAINNTGSAITVNYTISGSATSGTDYAALSGSVVIANGQQTATINVAGIVDDAIVEGNETVVATITGTDNALFTIDTANDDATVTINDNDNALNSVTITATDVTASETPTDNGEFTIDLGAINNTGAAVTVNYTITGTATSGTDYAALSGSVVIANGQQTATINVAGIVDDALIEGNETVVATITGTSSALFTVDTANDDATVTINDNDNALNSVTITASDPNASETPTDNGEFTIDLGAINNTGAAVTVNYTIAGTATATNDYTALSGSVTIANGQQTATINVAGIVDDALIEGNETVVATITGTSSALFTVDTANDDATVTITDNENAFNGVTISATDANANETLSDSGEFTIDLGAVNNTGSDITVTYAVTGTATAGSDYTALSGSVIIANGQQAVTINVAGIVDDILVEGSETVTATITNISNALFTADPLNSQASVTIGDNDNSLNSVTITATDATANETPTDNGEFTIDLGAVNNTGGDVVVNYTMTGTAISGTDYAALSGSVTVANGQQTATINVAGIVDDALVEGNETVVATITGTDNALFTIDTANDNATVTINDNDNALNSVTITASDPTASETPTNNGEFTIDLGAINNTGAAVTVNYTIAGTATSGTDYAALSGSVTIANGQQTATINVAGIVDDALVEGNETVVATITGTSSALFTVDTANDDATVTINDNDNALNSVTIIANDPTASETPTDNGEFTIDLGAINNTGAAVTVNYTIAGTATSGTDFAALSGSVTIANGQQTATINVAGIVDDAIVEADETVVATITGTSSALFTVDTANDNATVIISDNDNAAVTVTNVSVNEALGTISFAATLNNAVQNGFNVDANYSNGTAIGGVDFDDTTDTLTFIGVAGETQIFTVAITDDAMVEANENFTVSLSNVVPVSAPLTSIDATDTAVGTIIDNDTAIVSIIANDAVSAEPGDDGQFTVSLSNVSSTDTVINYSISGDAISGSDFSVLTGTVTILAGQTSASIDVNVIDDTLLEDYEALTITLTGISAGDTDISIGAANSDSVTINDNDTAQVSIGVIDSSVNEEGDSGQFIISLTNPSDTDTVISYNIGGTASNGVDYQTLTGSATILAGSTSVLIDVIPLDDQQFEGDESVILTLVGITSGDADITLGAADTATLLIAEDDLSIVSENLLNLEQSRLTDSDDGTSFDRLRVPGAVIDAVNNVDSSVFGDRINSYSIDDPALNAPGTLTGFVYRSVLPETGPSSLSSVFPLRIGELDDSIDNRDQLLIKSWSINQSIFLEVLYIDVSGYELNSIDVSQVNGEALPAWLLFDSQQGLLSGNAPGDLESIKLRVLVQLSDGIEILRYIEVDVKNAIITEIINSDDIELSGVKPFSNQIDMFAKRFSNQGGL